ncbi:MULTISPECIES: recombinase family protein [Enterobacterales]|uniref:Recombinase family protein n=1 Tax=Raoultella scottii TaxID=3040937 RepID=A0ABU8Z2C6_9ENTR
MVDKTEKIHKVRVAQYLRMSTNLQEFSLDNQAQFIKKYANEHNMEILYTYDDAGKSGVSTTGRHDFNKLVNDVLTKEINIDAVLVYDVSRFGRFKDPQEGIYYKYLLKMNNVDVIYCAENLPENSETETFILSSLMYAAGAFSKNLSIKVFAGHVNLVKRGYYQGGKAGYGLKRKLLDNNNKHKMILAQGERKSLQTDRIVLVPGTKKEVELVKKIFNMFIFEGLNEYLIASRLNREGYRFSDKTEWTRGRIHSVLINSRYTGKYTYNRTSQKLKTKKIKNPENEWIEYNSFFKPIISEEKFKLAKEIIDNRSVKMSNEKILDCLRKILSKHGKISGFIIDEEDSSPSSSVIANRFGGLLNAYKLIDYTPERDYQYLEINSYLRKKHCDIVKKIKNEILSSEVKILENKLITVNKALNFSIVLSRCKKIGSNRHRWIVRLDRSLNPEISIIARMNSLNTEPIDYYILPSIDFFENELKLKDNNNLLFEMYRFDDIKPFFNMLSTDDKDVI